MGSRGVLHHAVPPPIQVSGFVDNTAVICEEHRADPLHGDHMVSQPATRLSRTRLVRLRARGEIGRPTSNRKQRRPQARCVAVPFSHVVAAAII